MQSGKQDAEPSEGASESKTLQMLPSELPSSSTLRFCGQECKTDAVLQITDVGSTLDMSTQPEDPDSCTTEKQSGKNSKKHCQGTYSSLDTVAYVPTPLFLDETNLLCVPNFSKQASSRHGQPGFRHMTLVSEFGSTNGHTSMTKDQLQPLKDEIKEIEHGKEQRSLMREICLCPLTGNIMEDPVTAQVNLTDLWHSPVIPCCFFSIYQYVLTWNENVLPCPQGWWLPCIWDYESRAYTMHSLLDIRYFSKKIGWKKSSKEKKCRTESHTSALL